MLQAMLLDDTETLQTQRLEQGFDFCICLQDHAQTQDPSMLNWMPWVLLWTDSTLPSTKTWTYATTQYGFRLERPLLQDTTMVPSWHHLALHSLALADEMMGTIMAQSRCEENLLPISTDTNTW
jgi:hypothetical protein